MARDVVMTTPELRRRRPCRPSEFMYSADREWGLCVADMHRLWHFTVRDVCWLQLTRTRKPGSWKIRLSCRGMVYFLDAGCPLTDEALLWGTFDAINKAGPQLIPQRAGLSRPLYVRMFHRRDGGQ